MSARGGEFGLIARHFAPLAKHNPGAFGLTDDAALIPSPGKGGLVVTADGIVAGVHFLPDDPPQSIARKLLRVNLSDLAAKGAVPLGYLLTAAFPRDVDDRWIAAFARGLKVDQAHFGIVLYGGDTVATPGPASFSVTMFGRPIRKMVRRSGARPGDLACVTGTIGDGGLGLTELRTPHDKLLISQRKFLIGRYRIPQPRTRFAATIATMATASLDISDGLIQDFAHLAQASGVRLTLQAYDIPLSPAALALERADPSVRARALTAGDDYEIAFTIPLRHLAACRAAAAAARIRLTVIGRAEAGQGVDIAGLTTPLPDTGFDHFRAR